jgi:hypothetical protein
VRHAFSTEPKFDATMPRLHIASPWRHSARAYADAPTPPKFRAGATLEQFLADLPYAFALDLHQAFGEPGGRHCVNTPATKRLTAL